MQPPSTPKRIVFTGGSGRAGRHLIPYLQAAGHHLLNLDLTPLRAGPPPPGATTPEVHTIVTDLTSPGQVFSALSSHFAPTEPLPPHLPPVPDAVVHFAGLSTPLQVPDSETFRVNVVGTHNVLEAACKLGIKKVIVASSVTVYGVTFAQGKRKFKYFPVDEEHETIPEDVYAMSKVCIERTCEGFAKRFREKGVDVYVLRIARVCGPEEYKEGMWQAYLERPGEWASHAWVYTDVRDLGGMIERCLDVDGLGFRVWNAVNDSMTNYEEVEPFLEVVMPGVARKWRLEGRDGPISNRKIKEELGWREKWDWLQLVDPTWEKEKREAFMRRENARS
jgi:nucleoside-diphosphate-sugar epimerase